MNALARLLPVPQDRARSVGREAAVWVITLFLFQAFVTAGYRKLLADSGWTEAFTHWGYPSWFRQLVGVCEIVGSLLILYPRVAAYGATLIFAVMVGAVGTHIRVGEYLDAYHSDLPSLCFSAALILARWPAMPRAAPEPSL